MIGAQDLADCYDRSLFAIWRGEEDDPRSFMDWLSQFSVWGPLGHGSIPVATSPMGGSGRGIRWYETDDAVLGCVDGPDQSICYRVPRTASLPPAPVAPLSLSTRDVFALA